MLPWTIESALIVQDLEFDLLLSLDKDLEACALANRVRARVRRGFSQWNGGITTFDQNAHSKWERGVFDDLMKANRQHYIAETFEVCGFDFREEEYLLPEFRIPSVDLNAHTGGKKIALNTGAGDAWKPRKYSENRWVETARALKAQGHEVFLVGGSAEHELNQRIQAQSGAKYFGHFSMNEFIGLLSLADAVVTSVSFAFHVAVGLKKPIALLNNTFNPHEFYMYGRGVVLEPKLDCLMCYKNDFDENCVTRDCMDLIEPNRIVEAVSGLVAG